MLFFFFLENEKQSFSGAASVGTYPDPETLPLLGRKFFTGLSGVH